MKKSTQNDWKKKFHGWAFDHDRRYFKSAEGKKLMSLISKFLTDARKEVIEKVEKMKLDGLPDVIRIKSKDMPEGDTVEGFTYNAILDDVLATLRKEGK